MTFKKTYLILFSLYFFSTASGQGRELQSYQNGFYIKQFSEADGLVNNSCKTPYQDSRGFLWIGTFSRLSRFDGKQFINYGIKEGLPGTDITQVSEDSSGLIYVATTTGIARYTGYNKSSNTCFYTYPQTTGLEGYIAGMQSIDSNTIIFQKNSGAVYLLTKNKLLQLTRDEGRSGLSIYRNSKGYFYASVPDTLRVFNARFKNVKNFFWDQSRYSVDYMDNAGGLHLYSQGKTQGIKNDQMVYEGQAPDSIKRFAITDTLNAMFYDRNDIIYGYDGRTSTQILDMKKLSTLTNWLMQAKDGSIWATSSARGLFRITALPYKIVETKEKMSFYYKNGKRIVYDNNSFNKIPAFTRARDSLKQITIAIVIDRKGNAWFCTKNGLYKQPPNGPGQAYIFHGNKARWNDRYTEIFNGIELPNGDLWFYGLAGAIFYRNDEFKHYTPRNGLTANGGATARVFGDKDGNVLLVNLSKKLFYVAGDTVLPALNAAGTSGFYANTLITDNKGYAWIENNKTIYRLEKQINKRFAVTDSIIPSEINTAEIIAFDFDLQGNCWVNYAGGDLQVFFLNSDGHYGHTNSVAYTKDDGLGPIGLFTSTLCPDENGNILLIPRTKDIDRFLSFSVENALKRKQLQTLTVSIVGIELNHEKADRLLWGNLISRNVIAASIRLPYDENNIIFNYNSSSLSHPSSVRYKIMLEGFDKKWQVTNSTSANYTNLPAGTYTFLVQAANVNGTWGPVLRYPFAIQPPWYKTWWATLIWIALSVLIIYLIFSIRLNAIRISHLKESGVFKSDLIGLIGHDMVTPLLYIAKVSLQLRNYNEKLSKQTTLDGLGEINTTATKLHFFGESIVHWIKVQNNDFKPVVEKFHVNKTIKDWQIFISRLLLKKEMRSIMKYMKICIVTRTPPLCVSFFITFC